MICGGLRIQGKLKKSLINQPLITVITVVYNGAATLEQTICSVVEQIYSNIEFIIVDGGSSDNTLNILKNYDDKIDYWISEPDGGIYDAMNKGIKLASGDYIYIIGCDDWLCNRNVFSDIIQYMIKGFDVISGRVWLVYKNGYQRIYDNRLSYTKEEDIMNRTISSPHQGMFVKSSFMKNNLFDTNYSVAADYKSLLTIWLNSDISICKVPNIIAFYSNEGTSKRLMTKRRTETLKIIDEFKFWDKLLYNQKTGNRKITWYIKNLLINLGMNKVKYGAVLFLGYFKGVVKKHSCEWKRCRFCN